MSKRNIQKYRIMKQLSMDIWGLFKKVNYRIRTGQHGKRRVRKNDRRALLLQNKKFSIYDFDKKSFIRRIKKFYINSSLTQIKNIAKSKKLLNSTSEAQGIKNVNIVLERRIDMIVFRLHWAFTLFESRQLVSHGAFLINGKQINRSSALIDIGDVISVNDQFRKRVVNNIDRRLKLPYSMINIPTYLEARQDIPAAVLWGPIEEEMIPYPTF